MSKAVSPQPSTASYNSIDEIDFEEEPVDTGLIRCVCDSSEDDGFTIQCERCLVWQHAYCVKISQHNIPDHYLCDQCENKLKKLVAAGDFRAQVAGFMRGMEINGIGVISKGKQRARPESAKRIDSEKNSLADDGDEDMELEENVKSPATGRPSQQYRKNPVGRPPSRKPKLSKRISMPKRSMQDIQSADSSLLRRRNASRPGRKRKQSSGEYQHTDSNYVRSEHAYQVFQDTIDRWKMIMNRRKELNGSKSGMEIPFLVAMNDGIPSPSPDISTRQLSPELQQGGSTKSDKSLRKGVFADTFIPANQFLTEVTGDIILKSEYKFDPRNDFVMLGTPRPHVFFYPTIDLCVDARTRGNEARFVRRSCHPNAELRGILLPNAAKDQTVHLGLFTRNDVQKGQEITIGWGWQRGHISWMKNLEWHNLGRAREGHHVVDEEDERSKRAATGDMLEFLHEEFGDCACKDSKACFIYYLDKEQESQAGFDRSIYSTPKTPVKRNWWKAEFGTSDNDQAEVGEEKQIKRQSVDAKSLQIKDSLAPASRQSIVSAAKEVNGNGPSDSADENVDIDIISTSPVVGSPVISAPTTMNDGDNEDDLDIDGDIDVGQENVETPGAAGQDAEGSTSKEIRSVAGNASKEAAKLPCKKNWMRTYLKQVENVGSVNQSVKQPSPSNETASSFLPLNEKEDVDVEMESENKPESSTKVDAVKSKNQGDQVEVNMTEPTSVKTEKPESNIAVAAATADKGALPGMNGPTALSTTLEAPSQAPMEEIDEGEMSDASSASTIPLDDQSYQETSVKAESASKVTANIDVDMDNAKAPEEAKMSEEVTTHHEATGNKRPDMSANDAEQSKPTKVKLSLQEYLSRRAAGQSLTNELAGEQQKTKEKEPSLNGPDSKLSETTA